MPDWYDGDLNYLAYVLPENEYQPLRDYQVPGVKELGTFDFLATKEDVAKVQRSATGTDPSQAD